MLSLQVCRIVFVFFCGCWFLCGSSSLGSSENECMSETEFKSKFSFRLVSLVFHGPVEIGAGGSTFIIITEIMHTPKLITSVGLQCTYIISIHMCNNLFESVLSYVHIWQQGLGFREQYQRNHTYCSVWQNCHWLGGGFVQFDPMGWNGLYINVSFSWLVSYMKRFLKTWKSFWWFFFFAAPAGWIYNANWGIGFAICIHFRRWVY
jgi:hypothetical protein